MQAPYNNAHSTTMKGCGGHPALPISLTPPFLMTAEDTMRASRYLIATQKETPSDAEIISHQLPDGPPVEFVIRDADPRRIKSLDIKLMAITQT